MIKLLKVKQLIVSARQNSKMGAKQDTNENFTYFCLIEIAMKYLSKKY